ncbi:hypothetical protein CHH61_03575 [Shouchella clausii]|uniref:Uncharacterized protein n=1 Tax=Shouchella clausii TaxID=79880 RepID=A0A268S6V4_SHOCL|nr:hypothetical protein [Shouchella clausii]PAF27411.1 hypothetical protein CHH61_03575 [Shouchella clausii]
MKSVKFIPIALFLSLVLSSNVKAEEQFKINGEIVNDGEQYEELYLYIHSELNYEEVLEQVNQLVEGDALEEAFLQGEEIDPHLIEQLNKALLDTDEINAQSVEQEAEVTPLFAAATNRCGLVPNRMIECNWQTVSLLPIISAHHALDWYMNDTWFNTRNFHHSGGTPLSIRGSHSIRWSLVDRDYYSTLRGSMTDTAGRYYTLRPLRSNTVTP